MTSHTPQEQNDQQNDSMSTEMISLREKFVKDYISSKMNEDFIKLYDNIIDAHDLIPENIKTDLERFKTSPGKGAFSKIEIKDINYLNFLRFVLESGGSSVPILRDTAVKTFENFYELPDSYKIYLEIKKLKQNDIHTLMNSEVLQRKFLKKVYGTNVIVTKKNISKQLETIPNVNYSTMTAEQKSALVHYFETGEQTDNLLSIIKMFTLSQKIALCERFIPVMNLKEMMNYGLVSSYDADEIIKRESYKILKAGRNNLDGFNYSEFENNLRMLVDKETVILPVGSHINARMPNIDTIINKIIDDNKLVNITVDNTAALSEQEEAPVLVNKENFIKQVKRDFPKFKGSDNFGNDIFFFGTRKNYDKEQNENVILEILEIGDQKIKVKERTSPNGIIKDSFIEIQEITHQNLLNIFSNFEFNGGSGEFKTRLDVNKEVESGKITESVNTAHIGSLEDLNHALNDIDDKGKKFKVEKGMVFEFGKNDDDTIAVCKVGNIDPVGKTLELLNDNTKVSMGFQAFYSAFNVQEGKRIANITTFDSVVTSLQQHSNTEKKFKDLVFKNDKFLPKNQETNDNHAGVKYFIGKDKKALNIGKIYNDSVDVIIGEWEEKDSGKGKLTKGQKANFSFEAFFAYLTKNKLEPLINNDEIEPQVKTNAKAPKQTWSLGNFTFGMHNFLTLTGGWKSFMKGIEDTLKENTELQSAEFALRLGKFLPDSMRQKFINKQESVQKKKMNEKVDTLMGMNLDIALKDAEKILMTRNAYEHEIEAALIFVIKKHGCLYPKNLLKYKGNFAWYEKLGGKVGDKMFVTYHKDCLVSNEPPTEEGLIIRLLGQQSSEKSAFYPKRRTTIVGEFSGAYSSGRNDGITGGETEGKTFTTFDGRKNLAIGKFKEGRHMFAIGAMITMYDKGGSAEDRNLLPFIILMTGMSRGWHQDTAGKVKGLAFKHQVPALFFAGNPDTANTYEKAVLDFAKQISDDCHKQLDGIISSRNNIPEDEIIDKIQKFWKEYGSKLTPKLTTTDFSVFIDSESNNNIKAYNGIAGAVAAQNEQFTKDNFDNGIYENGNGLMPLTGGRTYISNLLQQSNSGHKEHMEKVGKNFIEYVKGLEKYKHPSGDKDKTREDKKKIFIELNKNIAIYYVSNYNKNTKYKDMYKELAKKGFWLPTDENCNYSSSDVESGNLNKAFEKAFSNFEAGEPSINMKSLAQVKNDTVLKINDIMETPYDPTNNNIKTYKQLRSELAGTIKLAKETPVSKQSPDLKKAIKNADLALRKNKIEEMEVAMEKLIAAIESENEEEEDDFPFDMAV